MLSFLILICFLCWVLCCGKPRVKSKIYLLKSPITDEGIREAGSARKQRHARKPEESEFAFPQLFNEPFVEENLDDVSYKQKIDNKKIDEVILKGVLCPTTEKNITFGTEGKTNNEISIPVEAVCQNHLPSNIHIPHQTDELTLEVFEETEKGDNNKKNSRKFILKDILNPATEENVIINPPIEHIEKTKIIPSSHCKLEHTTKPTQRNSLHSLSVDQSGIGNHGPNSWRTTASCPTLNLSQVETLSPDGERKVASIAYCLYFTLIEYFTPAVKSYLLRTNLLDQWSTNNDSGKLIYKLIYERKNNVHFLSTISIGQLYKAVQGHNAVCHVKLPYVFMHWEDIFRCWATVCDAVNDPAAACKIRTVHNRVQRLEIQQAVAARSLQLPLKVYDEGDDAFGMSEILYGCLLKFIAPSLRNFLNSKPHQFPSTSLDVFENLKQIIASQRQNIDYLANGGYSRNDSNTLNMSFSARNHLCHGNFFNIFRDWELYLVSWLQLLDVIREDKAKSKVKYIYDTLIKCKKEGRSIHPAIFFLKPLFQ